MADRPVEPGEVILTSEPGKIHWLEPNWELEARLLADGLSWAVGYLEGLGQDPGYAKKVLERWRSPQALVRTPE